MRSYPTVFLFGLVLLALACLVKCQSESNSRNRASSNEMREVAIVGGGLGGAMVFFDLMSRGEDSKGGHQQQERQLKVTLFEKSARLGGRIESFTYNKRTFDAGKKGGFTLSEEFLQETVNKVGLQAKLGGGVPSVSIYQEQGPTFSLSSSVFLRPVELVEQFPISSILLLIQTSSITQMMRSMYNVARKSLINSFHELLKLLSGADELTEVPFDEYFKSSFLGIGTSLATSYLRSMTQAAYGQDEKVNALAGYLGYFLWSTQQTFIPEGLEVLTKRLVSASEKLGGKVILNSEVSSVERRKSGKQYRLHFASGEHQDFDDVVIAFPLERMPSSKLSEFLMGFNESEVQMFSGIKYEDVTITFVEANGLNKAYTKANSTDIFIPSMDMKAHFQMIELACDLCGIVHSTVYKMTSAEPISETEIKQVFGSSSQVIFSKKLNNFMPSIKTHDASDTPKYKLREGLYYLHAAERIAPMMLAIESVSAKIISNLLDETMKEERQLGEQSTHSDL